MKTKSASHRPISIWKYRQFTTVFLPCLTVDSAPRPERAGQRAQVLRAEEERRAQGEEDDRERIRRAQKRGEENQTNAQGRFYNIGFSGISLLIN